ncbi:universal stress protein [Desulfobacterota bacterium M19]
MDKTSKVIVPIDFTSTTDKVVKYAVSIADKMGAHVIFLHVVNDFHGYDMLLVHPSFSLITNDLKEKAEEKVADLVESYQDLKYGASGKVIIGNVAKEIVDFAADENAEMIIIGARGVKGLEELLMGSTAKKVLNTALCPVLTFHPFRSRK